MTLFIILIILSCSFLQTQKGTITKIIDGYTYLVQYSENNEIRKVRLWGIDSPDKNQSFGITTKNYCIGRYLNTTVVINIKGVDRYNRTAVVLSLAEEVF
jgi:micrococcal nuclease